jgi:Cysteine-rich CWC
MSVPSNKGEPSVCASCGETFGCGAKLDGCWCMKVTLSDEATAAIAKDLSGCLCPKCLASFASRAAMKLTYPDGSEEILPGAVRVDTTNYHEGMFDFYDAHGNLMKQVAMGSGVNWEEVSKA